MKILILVCGLLASMFSMGDCSYAVGHGGHGHRDYGKCRRKIEYGGCHQHVRRWAYNISCGQCVPFDYSGCGGFDNNFSCLEDCQSCCSGCTPCPRYSLPRPHHGCDYRWFDDDFGCPRPRLNCHCPKLFCRPDACRHGQRCIPHLGPCNSCPCHQYRCVSDPCIPLIGHLRPCERCIAIPEPGCRHDICPLIAHRENHCGPFGGHFPFHGHGLGLGLGFHHGGCAHHFPCPPTGSPCLSRSCPRYPAARCIVDPCDCRKYHWSFHGASYTDADCFF